MPSTRRSLLLVSLVVVSSVAAAATVVVGGGAPTQGCFPGVDEVEREEAVGDVVTVEILHCFSGSITVEGPGYEGTVRLASDDYSGGVTIHVDTRRSGAGALSATAETFPDDALSSDATGEGTFATGTYEITVRDGSGDVVDRTNVTLSEPTAEDVRIWRAPRGAAADIDGLEEVRASHRRADAIDDDRPLDGSSEDPTLSVATNETIVVAVEATGIEGTMTSDNGTPLDRFRTAIRSSPGEFEFEQTEETAAPELRLLEPDLLNGSTTHLVPDAANDTYYLVVDTRELAAEREGTSGRTVYVGQEPGMGFAVRFWMRDSSNESAPPADYHAADFAMVEAKVAPLRTGPDDRVALEPSENATLRARTTLAPGTPVTVSVVRGATLGSVETVVGADGNLTAALPLAGVSSGNATIRFDVHGRTLTETTATVSTVEGGLSIPNQSGDGERVRVRNLTTNRVAVLAIYEGTDVNGEPFATTPVDPETAWDVSLPLYGAAADGSVELTAALYVDVDADGRLDAEDELVAVDTGRYRVENATATPSETTTATTRKPTSETRRPGTTLPARTKTTGPGFAIVGTLFALLAGVSLLARR